MATILRHGSFVFFIYICVASLLYLLGSPDQRSSCGTYKLALGFV